MRGGCSMGGQEVQLLEGIVSSQYVWAILCLVIGVTYYRMMKSNATKMEEKNDKKEQDLQNFYAQEREESKERELNLMNHLERSNETHERTAETLNKIEESLHSLDSKMQKMDNGINDIWKRIDEIDNRDEE